MANEHLLPAPRLQLRWERYEGDVGRAGIFAMGEQWACHYELVLPLREHDIRREIYEDGEQVGERSELVVPLKGPSIRGSVRAPCDFDGNGGHDWDTPYRDGAHAKWDALALGGLPIFVIALDGVAIPQPEEDRLRAALQSDAALTSGGAR